MGWSPLSDLSGWVSIGCWLFAQFPQVLENIRRQSCDGLALPFLFNWLLGDCTNLIGCLLTHQLPFQTILATYFVFVDFTLFLQYFYYGRRTVKLEAVGELPPSPPQQYSRRISTDHEHQHHYRELSSAAAEVAIAAALAASEEELLVPVNSKDNMHLPNQNHRQSGTSITRSEEAEAEDEVDEDALAALADSFHSESGKTLKRVSWSQERYGSVTVPCVGNTSRSRTRASGRANVSALTPLHRTSSSAGVVENSAGTANIGPRGRPLSRQVVDSPTDIDDVEGDADFIRRSVSGSAARVRKNSRASQRSAGLVFLGAWALFGIGTLSQRGKDVSPSHGIVLSSIPRPTSLYPVSDTSVYSSSPLEEFLPLTPSLDTSMHSQTEEPSAERIIGRIFAWTCTTLYLTSRLPQIWKNYVRKSVEGLSMYLFVFAFLGNTFYVLSILSSPMMSKSRPIATAFLLESMPYLLGSAGTLLFDVTIVSQSFLYRPRHHTHPHHHHHSHSHPHHSHAHSHSHGHRYPSSYSQSRTNSYQHAQKRGSMDSVPEEERALLGSPPNPPPGLGERTDLERGPSFERVHGE